MSRPRVHNCVVVMLFSVSLVMLLETCLQPALVHGGSDSALRAKETGAPVPAPTPQGRSYPGHVSGTVFIQILKSDISLNCKDFEIEARQVGGSQALLAQATAYGDLGKKSCRYSIEKLPVAIPFELIVLKPKAMEGSCTQEKFVADGTLPLKLKSNEKLFRNLTIRNVTCIVVK